MWEKFYLSYKNNQIRFSRKIKGSPKFIYVIANIIVRMTTKYIVLEGERKLRKISCLMLCHRYDKLPIFITTQPAYEMEDFCGETQLVVNTLLEVKI